LRNRNQGKGTNQIEKCMRNQVFHPTNLQSKTMAKAPKPNFYTPSFE
jgi:hypothetical protein